MSSLIDWLKMLVQARIRNFSSRALKLRQQLLTFGMAHCEILFAEIGHGPTALVCVRHQGLWTVE